MSGVRASFPAPFKKAPNTGAFLLLPHYFPTRVISPKLLLLSYKIRYSIKGFYYEQDVGFVDLYYFGIWFFYSVYAQDFNDVKYIRNYDGDTLNFDLGDDIPQLFRKMPLRLYGIDTPEIKAKSEIERTKAIEVRDFVTQEMKNAKRIDLLDCSKGKYFRILCNVSYDGKNLTNELLKRKMGYEYFGGKKLAK